ncbi:hypothetical protein GE09DRAFT_1048833 [Coniochaeta sp. 2T2.1]|nr:hypothetical protein GE09DRAFT_1048833 [Coniochaeta sp. 2T2.1]
MNKNWNDRADKDLFFTILSIKNIGVISGPEWTAIGNHMRTLGYGFTNEGCRQHFQGLRRAQQKIEGSVASPVDSPRKVGDPTLNPITRRPGPGRGRPKKQASSDPAAPGASASPAQQPLPPIPPTTSIPSSIPSLMPSSMPSSMPPALPSSMPSSMPSSIPQPHEPHAQSETPGSDAMAVDPSLDDQISQPAKRPRLEENVEPSIEDEAVLNALAAHANPSPGDHYAPDFTYGEA